MVVSGEASTGVAVEQLLASLQGRRLVLTLAGYGLQLVGVPVRITAVKPAEGGERHLCLDLDSPGGQLQIYPVVLVEQAEGTIYIKTPAYQLTLAE
ncbi:MAG: hypothetical protein PHC60_02320 [Heliobacteriaceae bacterium]|nr:hypothetical protein [Heliobacteriaceae bacterium]